MKGFTNEEINLIHKRLDEIWEQGSKEENALIKDVNVRKSFKMELFNRNYTMLFQPNRNLTEFTFAYIRDNQSLDFNEFIRLDVVYNSTFPFFIGSYYLQKGKVDLSDEEKRLLYINGLMFCLFYWRAWTCKKD